MVVKVYNKGIESVKVYNNLIERLKMAMTATQLNRSCQNFINVIEKKDHYEQVK